MKCPMCNNSNVEKIYGNLYRCNDCGHRFFGDEDVEGNRAGFSRQAEVEDSEDNDDTSEFDGILGIGDDDALFPP
jgi:ribosomal protein L37AE/L43A